MRRENIVEVGVAGAFGALILLMAVCVAESTKVELQRKKILANEPITIVIRHGEEEVLFPVRPPRTTCGSRDELLELLGSISTRKNSLGQPLLKAMESPEYASMMEGHIDRFVIDVADKNEFEAVKKDIQSF